MIRTAGAKLSGSAAPSEDGGSHRLVYAAPGSASSRRPLATALARGRLRAGADHWCAGGCDCRRRHAGLDGRWSDVGSRRRWRGRGCRRGWGRRLCSGVQLAEARLHCRSLRFASPRTKPWSWQKRCLHGGGGGSALLGIERPGAAGARRHRAATSARARPGERAVVGGQRRGRRRPLRAVGRSELVVLGVRG